MNSEQQLIDLICELSAEQQEEILAHARKLRASSAIKLPRVTGRGLWADFDIDLTAEDIDLARREMWGSLT